MERKWIAVAFGDILGFGIWAKRAANTSEVRDPFIVKFYREIERFLEDHPCIYAKYLGDGFMLVKELPENNSKKNHLAIFCQELIHLTHRLIYLIKQCPYPPPVGFRTRVAVGHSTKFLITDPNDKMRKIPEYVSYIVNLTQRMLEVHPEIPFICHESVVKAIHVKKKTFKIKRLGNIAKKPRGVDPQDIDGLWFVEF